ncbi:hypothetical protein Fcan01_10270 [Folsomia candida]|uniref:Uncharacterized protein n=1 Tax=Folsomia candida TaxID=158441 RepID=A0A226EB03_FOLCA|nr:hypothetical protein Fcan01_10270 [Folsomia candida]
MPPPQPPEVETLIPTFSKLSLKNSVSTEKIFFSSIRTQTSPFDLYQGIIQLTNPLKKLKLDRLRFEQGEDYAKFEKLLQKHANTLEELHFTYDVWRNDETLHLPILPRMLTLSVGWMQFSGMEIRFPSEQNNEDDDVLDYERHLPRLDALSLIMFPSAYPSSRIA